MAGDLRSLGLRANLGQKSSALSRRQIDQHRRRAAPSVLNATCDAHPKFAQPRAVTQARRRIQRAVLPQAPPRPVSPWQRNGPVGQFAGCPARNGKKLWELTYGTPIKRSSVPRTQPKTVIQSSILSGAPAHDFVPASSPFYS